jgi:hypothetical protein
MKKGWKEGRGVWLGIVSGVGTPDTTDAVSRAFLRGQPYMGRVRGFSAAQAQPFLCVWGLFCVFCEAVHVSEYFFGNA